MDGMIDIERGIKDDERKSERRAPHEAPQALGPRLSDSDHSGWLCYDELLNL